MLRYIDVVDLQVTLQEVRCSPSSQNPCLKSLVFWPVNEGGADPGVGTVETLWPSQIEGFQSGGLIIHLILFHFICILCIQIWFNLPWLESWPGLRPWSLHVDKRQSAAGLKRLRCFSVAGDKHFVRSGYDPFATAKSAQHEWASVFFCSSKDSSNGGLGLNEILWS